MTENRLKLVGLLVLGLTLISGTVDLDNLFNYSNQSTPDYVLLDNTPLDNQLDDAVATLGRVLFYDKKLSSDNSVSCASCHTQDKAFGLQELQGDGVNGPTLRHPIRLVNLRQRKILEGFFWDERTSSIEALATDPIQDHLEMGYSGENGDPSIQDLILQMEELEYYEQLFSFAFGDDLISEDRMSKALAQFLRSIQSYDSRFDTGYSAVGGSATGQNLEVDFPNFNEEENLGKLLFVSDPIVEGGERIGGGVGCTHCHFAPNFHFQVEFKNNGVVTEIEGSEVLDITKAPSLRDVFGPDGTLNGPLFHNGQATTFDELLDHYNNVSPNSNLDFRIVNNGIPLNLTADERVQIEAFVKTLNGTDIYSNEMWSDPFDEDGNIEVIGGFTGVSSIHSREDVTLYPNPTANDFTIDLGDNYESTTVTLMEMNGKTIRSIKHYGGELLNLRLEEPAGVYLLKIESGDKRAVVRVVKE